MPIPISASNPLRVIVSLDVEEEGLFSGRYARTGCGVTNVARLKDLAPISDELGFPLTLFCSWTVLMDPPCQKILEEMRDRHGAEIGGHLHHWSTPPFEDDSLETAGEPTRTDRLPRELLRKRLESLLKAGSDFQSAPIASFRMGRWDCKASILPLLREVGITADSSVCPLRRFKNGADHFLAPSQPYWPMGREAGFLESPVTQVPLFRGMERLWKRLCPEGPRLDSFHFLGALSCNPFWHSDGVMRLAARLVRMRGGPVLSLFWHSSEMLPGASPHVPDEAAARHVLNRIRTFLSWLRESGPVKGVTLGELAQEARKAASSPEHPLCFPERRELQDGGDW